MTTPYAIFVDDHRQPRRDDGIDWVHCETVNQMLGQLQVRGVPNLISFDFDLGETETYLNGEHALIAFLDALKQVSPNENNEIEVRFHSSDVGKRSEMRSTLEKHQGEMASCGWSVWHSDPSERMDKILGI